jgi:hypothetical protein
MSDLAKSIEKMRQQEIKIARAGGYGSDWLEEESKISDSDLDQVEQGLAVKLPLSYRTFLKSFRVEKGDADFSICRMSDLILLNNWEEIFENMGIGGETQIQQAIRSRKLFPIGDDYSGLSWICLDLAATSADGVESPLVELNLEAEAEVVSKNFDKQVEKLGDSFVEGIEALQKRMLSELDEG